MQALKAKQQEQAKLRDILNGESNDLSAEERVDRCRSLQYDQHQQLFAVAYSSIHKAAAENSLSGVKYFLSTGRRGGRVGTEKSKMFRQNILEELNKNGMSPLHCAAEKGAMDVIRFLLEQECNIDGISREGNSALMYACKANQIAVIRLLVEKNANFLLVNKTGMNAVHFAAQCDNFEAIEALVESVQQQLETIAESGEVDEEDEEEDSGEGEGALEKQVFQMISQPSNNKTTPLHIACSYGAEKSVETLIRCGASVNAQDSSGDTPLHKAARNSFYQIYRYLLSCGASDEIVNDFRESAADALVDHPSY